MRPCRDAVAVQLRQPEEQPDANPNPNTVSVVIGQPIRDRNRQRLRDAMPIAVCDGDAITVAER